MENIMLAVAGLKANKMRSLLTMLGIIIGISSVISIVSIGNSLSSELNDTLSQLGANNIVCQISPRDNDWNSEPDDSDLFSDEDVDNIKSIFKNKIENISVSHNSTTGTMRKGYSKANVSIVGVNSDYGKVENINLIKGRFISEDDVKGDKRAAVVSDDFVKKIFKNNENPLGKEIKITCTEDIKTYYIVGVYRYQTNMFERMGGMESESERTTQLYTTVSSVVENEKNKNYSYMTLQPAKGTDSRVISEELTKYLAKHYKDNKKYTASAYALENEAESMNKMLSTVSIVISVIAAISLLVGGIGVMNIMLVSVTERTKEIGTRKALGAQNYHIQIQFITEAVIICAIGGIIGIALGISIGACISMVMGTQASISIPTILISFVFSMTIGVFFGLYPARKAAKLDPIEALRYE